MKTLTAPVGRFGLALVSTALFVACGKSPPSDPPAAVYGTPAAAPAPAPSPDQAEGDASNPTPPAQMPAQGGGSQTLAYPEDLQMVLLAHRLTGTAAPLEDWAAKASAVTSANEFSRGDALKAESARLAAIQASTADIGFIKLNTSGNLSEYDATRGGFYMTAFQPGTVYTFKAFNEEVSLQFSNGNAAYLWPLDAVAAQDVLKKDSSRVVNIDMTIAVERAERRSSGVQITGRVVDYRIGSAGYGNAPLGTVTVK